MYRIGVTSSDIYPIAEWERCHFVQEPFCLKKVEQVCKLLQGPKNYASFCHKLSEKDSSYPTVRDVTTFEIKPGRPLFDPNFDPLYNQISFYDVHVKSKGFMYKQVRRMISVLIAVAQNRMQIEDVEELFDKPGTWNPRAITAPAHGLYLLSVDYKILEDELVRPAEIETIKTSSCSH